MRASQIAERIERTFIQLWNRLPTSLSEHRPGTLCGIAQGFAQPIDGGVDAVIDVHKSVRRPKLLPELLPGDDLARMFQQKFQNLKRLLLELDLHPLFAQLASLQVGFESAKTQHAIFSNLG